ncbi:excitatory amino acid transporter 1 [Folsomia candida]|uniref:Amino acid transporter n=1 Tax=Folsomia candida TaxID=158441 RepID=A0A226F1Z3_FOLCA|nr:excitatory amino acid transporter 1 [Folsomia candida]OXA63221.1 Excitatory amino acid transporter 1 [Folsomia candida]
MERVLKFLTRRGNVFTILTLIGVAVGLGLGIGLRNSNGEAWTKRDAMYLRLPGDLFLRCLSGIMLPLIISSLVSATGSLDLSVSKKIGSRALVYYLSTSAIAAILGSAMVHFISPGTRSDDQNSEDCGGEGGSTIDTILDLLRNVFPPNIIAATHQNTRTEVTQNASIPFEDRDVNVRTVEGTNMLGLIVFSLVLGITLAELKEVGAPLLAVFSATGSAMLRITTLIIWAGPLAVCFLISGSLVEQGEVSEVFSNLSWYTGVMVGAYLLHGFVVLPILFFLLTRTLPFQFIRNISQAIFTAFGTASSSATLPITLKCLEENHKMDTRLTRFLIPIGATVNMDGAAIGVPLRVIYIAQLCGRSLSFGELVSITLTSLAASVGLAGIPGVAMVVTMTILGSMGLPVSKIAFVLPVDWLQDRVGTVVNVVGDAFGAGIIGHLSKADLKKIDDDNLTSTIVEDQKEVEEKSPSAELVN